MKKKGGKTVAAKKRRIATWRALFAGECPKCNGNISKGALVCRHPDYANLVIHYSCHPDWRPSRNL